LIALGGLLFDENVEGLFGEGCMRSMHCEVDFGYELSICARSNETHRKQHPEQYLKTKLEPRSKHNRSRL
jgi:hypothetical protein